MIEILKMGEDAWHDASFDVDRPNGFPEYLLLLTRTKGRFFIDGVWEEYPKNCVVLFKPYQKQRYHASEEAYMDCWMHFTSDRGLVEEHFPFGKPIVMHRPEEFYDLFHIICTQNYGLSHHRERIINHLVESLVYMILDESQTEAFSEVYDRLVALRQEIDWDPSREWSVPYMAQKLNISTGYLHTIYQEYFHTTCMNDVIKSRVKLACELLVSGDAPVAEIAERCGYHNTEHFIRQFKKSMHTTPGKYRKNFQL